VFDGISSIACTPTIPSLINLDANGNLQVSVRTLTWSKPSNTVDSTAVQTATPIFVSPVLTVTLDAATRTYQAFNALCEKVRQDQAAVAAVKPEDCHYLACEKAVDSIRITTINGIAFVKELFEIKQLVEPIIKILLKPLSVKNWASLILSWMYGWKLSWADWKKIILSFLSIKKTLHAITDYARFRNSLKTVYGTYNQEFTLPSVPSREPGKSRTNCRIVARWEIPTEANWLASLMALVEDFGIRLTGTNLWDLVPYSFVFDWFCDFGQFAKQWDFRCEVDRLRLRERIRSLHNRLVTTDTCYYEHFGFVGQITHDCYLREPVSEFPNSPMKLGGPSFKKHFFEGTLLILARIAKG